MNRYKDGCPGGCLAELLYGWTDIILCSRTDQCVVTLVYEYGWAYGLVHVDVDIME